MMKATLTTAQPRLNKFAIIAIILIVLVLGGLFTYINLQMRTASALPQTTQISLSTLEKNYGLRVDLIGVTAAGGLVDLRFKVLDAEKAKLLLKDSKNLPQLVVADSGIILNTSEDSQSQEMKLENDGNLFLLFPNAGNALKPGSPVMVRFGDISLEPIIAK